MNADALARAVHEALAGAGGPEEAVRLAVEMIHASSSRYDWTGIYLLQEDGMLVLSHFIGAPTPHARIPIGQGICGAAAMEKRTVVVPDVSADARYLACSIQTRSEIVVPILDGDAVLGEIDIDSHAPDAFGPMDRVSLEAVAALLVPHLRGGSR